METRGSERGTIFILALLFIVAGIGVVLAVELAGSAHGAQRERVTERALAQAREALIAYAADRPINSEVGPGYLPCPDLDNDGWAESTCGSQNGDSGQAARLGRLPWKTLGLADLRDGHGERLWYAVSSKYKGLLNCAASRACIDMTPDAALGTITVRDAGGTLLHDGTIAEPYRANEGGALAVVIAPGPPLARAQLDGDATGAAQERGCAPGECAATGRCLTDPPQRAATCNPVNYLDRAPGARYAHEDNAAFHDRNDAAGRAANRDGFIHGPVILADGRLAVNDRLTAIGYRDVMPRIMRRVALEVAHCLRFYAARPENGGRYPWPTPACAQADADPAAAWRDQRDVFFGRIPDAPFAAAAAAGGLGRWWRPAARAPENLGELPTRDNACRIAVPPADAGPQRSAPPGTPSDEGLTAGSAAPAWWTSWKPFVFYALARDFAPGAAGACAAPEYCLEVVEPSGRVAATQKHFAILVAGAPVVRDGFVQSRDAANLAQVREWLEDGNAALEGAAACPGGGPRFPCSPATCNRVTAAAASRTFNDVVVAFP